MNQREFTQWSVRVDHRQTNICSSTEWSCTSQRWPPQARVSVQIAAPHAMVLRVPGIRTSFRAYDLQRYGCRPYNCNFIVTSRRLLSGLRHRERWFTLMLSGCCMLYFAHGADNEW